MHTWLFLAGAIAAEVTATLSLSAAVQQPSWYALVVVGYIGAFAMLSLCLRGGMAVGVAYGVWAASGVALTAVLAALLFGDPLSGVMGLGIGLIIGGVLCVELGSHSRSAAADGARS